MMTNLDPASELFLAEASRIQERIAEANRQVSSGKRISTASDAPDQIGSLLQLRAQQSRNTQIQSNLVQAKANADTAENALASAITLMDSALTLASQGTNVSMTDTSRQALAQQVQSLQEQMVAISRTTVQGKYVFSGDQDGVAPEMSVKAMAERIQGSRVVVLEGCGHWTPYEKPQVCMQELQHFHAGVR